MALLRHRKLVCFYCGCRSAKVQDGSVRQWECTQCEAVNHLDENGEITDPPVPPTPKETIRFGHAIHRGAKNAVSDEVPFCGQCIQNQNLVASNLASYFPPPTDPRYPIFEANYPEYRENLEKRYPQVCRDCEPRVRERIRAAEYVAKTDHLRRMMEKTRGSGMQRRYDQTGWRGVVVLLGGLAWWGSILGQALWHFLWMMAAPIPDLFEESDEGDLSVVHCVRQAMTGLLVSRNCPLAAAALLHGGITLGILSIWWNNQLLKKLRGSGFRLVGLNEYYKLQVVMLVMRIAAAWGLQEGAGWMRQLDVSAVRGAHAFVLACLAVSTIVSLRTVSVNRGPRISFPERDIPLVTGLAANGSAAKQQTMSARTAQQQGLQSRMSSPSPTQYGLDGSQGIPSPKLTKGFGFATISLTDSGCPPPTPPPEDEQHDDDDDDDDVDSDIDDHNEAADPDAMDWTPTQARFTPSRPRTTGVSPLPVPSFSTFKRLPPAPKAPAAKLRTGQRVTPVFKTATKAEQTDFFNRLTALGGDPSQPHQPGKPTDPSMTLAQQTFFPQQAHDGSISNLEALFNAAFSIRDDPAEIRRAAAAAASSGDGVYEPASQAAGDIASGDNPATGRTRKEKGMTMSVMVGLGVVVAVVGGVVTFFPQ